MRQLLIALTTVALSSYMLNAEAKVVLTGLETTAYNSLPSQTDSSCNTPAFNDKSRGYGDYTSKDFKAAVAVSSDVIGSGVHAFAKCKLHIPNYGVLDVVVRDKTANYSKRLKRHIRNTVDLYYHKDVYGARQFGRRKGTTLECE